MSRIEEIKGRFQAALEIGKGIPFGEWKMDYDKYPTRKIFTETFTENTFDLFTVVDHRTRASLEWIVAAQPNNVLFLLSEIEQLRSALKDVFDLMDDGFIVRNVDNDDDPMWAIKMIGPMKKLSDAYKALGLEDG